MLLIVLGAIAIGLVLGLLGSGGSILTVPVLVYLAHEPDKIAIAESLAIVGGIALFGAVPYARQKLVDWHSVLYFGVPGIFGTWAGAGLSKWVPGAVQLAMFAIVMLVAAVLMFRGRKTIETPEGAEIQRQALWVIALEGLAVGILTGLVGVGGGFLIVPALVLLGGLSMRVAVGTSLLIVAAKSAAGFWKYTDVLADLGQQVDWGLIGLFMAIGIVGSLVGNSVGKRLPQAQLKRVFAVFLVVMGSFILVREGPRAIAGPSPVAAEAAAEAAEVASIDDAAMPATPTPETLAPEDFVAQVPSDAVVLDVRTVEEFSGGHLVGALNVDWRSDDFLEKIEALTAEGVLGPDQPVYLYCRTGNRSGQAMARLRELGYTGAVNVGGFEALRAAGSPTRD